MPACQRNCPTGFYAGAPGCSDCHAASVRLRELYQQAGTLDNVYGDVIHVPEDFRLPDLRNTYPSPK